MNGQVQTERIRQALAMSGLSVEDLWVSYYATGGAVSSFEIDAYLDGLLVLPVHERILLTDAANELLALSGVDLRIPREPTDEELHTPGDPRKAMGAAGAFLFTEAEQEKERLDAIARTGLLDTASEERFDRITREARDYFRVNSAIVALVDDRRQFLKAVIGPIEQNLPREISFCNTTIRQAGPLIVPDALSDRRFKSNPLVLGEPYIRFYAGFPLRGPGGWTIGTLCVIDSNPREYSLDDDRKLRELARRVEDEINGPRMLAEPGPAPGQETGQQATRPTG